MSHHGLLQFLWRHYFKTLVPMCRYHREIPDAYERLLLDAIEGERRLFIRSDELVAAWKLFTPLLNELEEKKIVPELYPYGSRGPVGAHYLAAKHKVRWGDLSGEDSWVAKSSPFWLFWMLTMASCFLRSFFFF